MKAQGFEKEVIWELCGNELPHDLIDQILGGDIDNYEYTGSGYYLTFKNSKLPSESKTCCEPPVMGKFQEIESGFVVFLGNHELVLECHTWGEIDVPSNFREQNVKISNKAT